MDGRETSTSEHPRSPYHQRALFHARRRPTQNIVNRLARRQDAILSPAAEYYQQRQLHASIFPSYTEKDVEVPNNCFLRKFTPDGSHLLAFSQDQRNIEVYAYRGAGAANHLYSRKSASIRESVFGSFLVYKFSVPVCEFGDALNRECSLFTPCCRYVIVGCSSPVHDNPYPHMYETFRNNESLSPSLTFALEDINLYIVDLHMAYVSDNVTFKCDKILLAHNQCLSLCGSKMAVLSLQHQTVHLFELVEGIFIHLHDIGRFCHPDDDILFCEEQFSQNDSGYVSTYQPFLEKWLNSLKHRFLTCLFRQAQAASGPYDSEPISLFFKRFSYFNSLRIWKMQLIDDVTLLLKYTTEQAVTATLRQTEAASVHTFYAVYDIVSTEMLAVYENDSLSFLRLFEQYADVFRSAVSHPAALHTSCVSNCPFARALHNKFKQTITNAKCGGTAEATKRLLMQLPVCSQSFSSSPYLDLSLFRYDDKWISPLERPKPLSENNIRFFSREGGFLKFVLQTSLPRGAMPMTKRLVAYIFHPHEPFAISIQKAEADYAVNLYFKNDYSFNR